jgi:predicted HTH domain antitoxin
MAITVTLDLPTHVEERLKAEGLELSAAVREGFALHLFRQNLISYNELTQILGLSRFETNNFLNRHNVPNESLTHDDIDRQVADGLRHLEKLGR